MPTYYTLAYLILSFKRYFVKSLLSEKKVHFREDELMRILYCGEISVPNLADERQLAIILTRWRYSSVAERGIHKP